LHSRRNSQPINQQRAPNAQEETPVKFTLSIDMETPEAVMVSDVIVALHKVIEDLTVAQDFANSQFPDTWEADERRADVSLCGARVGQWKFAEVR
jgi:hypothetical protein